MDFDEMRDWSDNRRSRPNFEDFNNSGYISKLETNVHLLAGWNELAKILVETVATPLMKDFYSDFRHIRSMVTNESSAFESNSLMTICKAMCADQVLLCSIGLFGLAVSVVLTVFGFVYFCLRICGCYVDARIQDVDASYAPRMQCFVWTAMSVISGLVLTLLSIYYINRSLNEGVGSASNAGNICKRDLELYVREYRYFYERLMMEAVFPVAREFLSTMDNKKIGFSGVAYYYLLTRLEKFQPVESLVYMLTKDTLDNYAVNCVDGKNHTSNLLQTLNKSYFEYSYARRQFQDEVELAYIAAGSSGRNNIVQKVHYMEDVLIDSLQFDLQELADDIVLLHETDNVLSSDETSFDALAVEKYRGIVGVTALLIGGFVAFGFILGITMGIANFNDRVAPTQRSTSSNAAAAILLSNTGFIVITAICLSSFVSFIFTVAAAMHLYICVPYHVVKNGTQSEKFRGADHLIDEAFNLVVALGNISRHVRAMSPSAGLVHCRADMSIAVIAGTLFTEYRKLSLDKILDESLVFNEMKYYFHGKTYTVVRTAKTLIDGLLDSSLKIQDLAECSEWHRLTRRMKDTQQILNDQDAEQQLRNLVEEHLEPNYNDLVSENIKMLIHLQNYTNETISRYIGPCRPLRDMYDILFGTLCSSLADNLNGFWLSLAVCDIFFLLAAVISIKISKYFQRMKSYTVSGQIPHEIREELETQRKEIEERRVRRQARHEKKLAKHRPDTIRVADGSEIEFVPLESTVKIIPTGYLRRKGLTEAQAAAIFQGHTAAFTDMSRASGASSTAL